MARPRAIKSLQDTPSKGGRNWLVYADSGAGKTVLSATAPRSLMLMCEAAGAESARMFGSNPDIWVMDSWKDFQEAYRYFDEGTGCEDYDWVVPDSLSELEEFCWMNVLKANSRPANRAAIQDYPEVWSKMKEAVDKWNRLPVNVLYTAQAFRLAATDDDDDATTLLLPLVGSTKRGDTAQKICGKVSLVGYLDVREREIEGSKEEEYEEYRRLWISKTTRMFAKSRHHKGVRFLDEPREQEVFLDVGDIDEEIRKRESAAMRERGRNDDGSVEESSDEPPTAQAESDTQTSDEAPARRKRRSATEPTSNEEE